MPGFRPPAEVWITRDPDIQSALNERGAAGWQLKQVILPSTHMGQSDSIVAILERQVG